MNCCFCGKEIGRAFIGVGDRGLAAHPHCFHKANPPRAAINLWHVARGASDPVLAAETLVDLIPADLAEQIVEEFNDRLIKLWGRRCAEPETEVSP